VATAFLSALLAAAATVASAWEYVAGPPKVGARPWTATAFRGDNAPLISRHALTISVTSGYCAGEPPTQIDHVRMIERPKTAARPFRSAVVTPFVLQPAPIEVVGTVNPDEPLPGCAGLGQLLQSRIKFKRPLEHLILYDGSYSPPRRAWPPVGMSPQDAMPDSPAKGEVGGPPSIPLGPPDEGKQMTPAVVIGRGTTFGGAVELVSYGWLAPRDSAPPGGRNQFCIWIEHLPDEISPGTCDAALDPRGGREIAIDDVIHGLGSAAQRFTEIGGRVSPDVASVRVAFRRPGNRSYTVAAVVGQVAGELQAKLKQSAPFGYFAAKIHGLVSLKSIRVRALDASGLVIDTTRGLTPHGIG
jgi:hypothetical protein